MIDLSDLSASIEVLDFDTASPDCPTADMVDALTALRALAADVATIEGQVTARLAARLNVPGGGPAAGSTMTATAGWKAGSPKWDHPAVIAKLREVAEGNDADPLDLVAECGAFSYWRVGPLRTWKVDPDDFRSRAPGKPTVELAPLPTPAAT